MTESRQMAFAGPLQPPAQPTLVEVRDLWYRYDDQAPALQGVSLSVAGGEWTAILGCNGSGKSTLVKHFNGLLRPWRGTVLLEGKETAGRPVGELARVVGYLPQNPDRLIFSPSVREEIAFGPRQQGLDKAAVDERVDEALGALELMPVAELPPAVLGYGLRRKVALAAVLALRPRLLVLDEPTNGLDAGNVQAFMSVVAASQRPDTAVVMVTHDLELVVRYAARAIVLRDGCLVAQGDTRSLLTDVRGLEEAGLMPLPVTQLSNLLAGQVFPGLRRDILTPSEFAHAYLDISGRRGTR